MKNGFYKYMYEVLNESIQQTDIEFYEKNIYTGKCIDMGSVASIVMILGDVLICANVGDCRAIMSRNGEAVLLSKDHKPYQPEEKKRIQEANGHVELDRVNGRLAVSRSFGDFRFKKEEHGADLITVEPEIRTE